ncbi:hypothetical protein VH12019_00031 [Vibrio phage VH1_2019]|uniref:GIY-YIG domain-containing protein n=1 Tax=Vibrio phage VH1_2019 TaxID=2686307 RepID=A0A6B9SVN6_9CAUD|nr:hypothetical protein VH12019_00031 [Vibrio phage VH1_2019]
MARIKWTLELIKEDALKYKTRGEWQKKSISGYTAARRRDVIDECCAHMTDVKKPSGYWTIERLKEDALKYKTRSEWFEKSSGYLTARSRGLIDECCAHMTEHTKPNGYWTIERLKEDALKYKTRSEWAKKSSGAYDAALRHDMLDDCCGHMKTDVKNLSKRCIYRIYSGNEIYIGLTYNADRRFDEHRKGTPQIVDLIERVGIENVIFERLTDYIEPVLAQIAEKEHIEHYESEGWVILNRAKGGSLGGDRLHWTTERIKEDALKYKTRNEWKNKSSGYGAAGRRGIIDECCSHMPAKYKWTLELIKEDALKYNTHNEWQKNSGGYDAARRRGILDECCAHMPKRAK